MGVLVEPGPGGGLNIYVVPEQGQGLLHFIFTFAQVEAHSLSYCIPSSPQTGLRIFGMAHAPRIIKK